MSWPFGASAVADAVLLAMAVELVLLVRAGRDPRAVLRMLLPGALLVLALRAALVGAGAWVAPLLALSFPFHLAELRARRWIGRRPSRVQEDGRTVPEQSPARGQAWRGR